MWKQKPVVCFFTFAEFALILTNLIGPCHVISPPTLLLSYPLALPIKLYISIGYIVFESPAILSISVLLVPPRIL